VFHHVAAPGDGRAPVLKTKKPRTKSSGAWDQK
jgi:hypothetical protein